MAWKHPKVTGFVIRMPGACTLIEKRTWAAWYRDKLHRCAKQGFVLGLNKAQVTIGSRWPVSDFPTHGPFGTVMVEDIVCLDSLSDVTDELWNRIKSYNDINQSLEEYLREWKHLWSVEDDTPSVVVFLKLVETFPDRVARIISSHNAYLSRGKIWKERRNRFQSKPKS